MPTVHFPRNIPTTPLWRVLYQDAILEFDDTKLAKRISQARAAIHDRSEEIATDPSSDERELLDNALQSLQVLEELAARKKSA
jgi:hypothetical protein